MRNLLLLSLLAVAQWGCSETTLSRAEAQIGVEPTAIDFGVVNLLSIQSEQLKVTNEGSGWLEIEGIEVLDDNGAFWASSDSYSLIDEEGWMLAVSFAPVEELSQDAILRLVSSAVDRPVVDVPLVGVGVRPVLDLLPSAMHFDTSEGATTESQTVLLESTGSGPVLITELAMLEDEETAFTYELPAAVLLPYMLEPGFSIEVTVTHEPVIGGTYGAELHIYSNDLNDEDQTVALAASGTGATGNEPEVEITEPGSGHAMELGDLVDLVGVVTDADQDADTLVVYFQSDAQGNLGTVAPDVDGNVSILDLELDAGTHTITLLAIDNQGNTGSDSVSVLVWEEGQTFDYVISGGDTPYHYFMVDDDVNLYLNGSLFFTDNDGGQNLHAPVSVTAMPGDVLRIEATDQIACSKVLDGLYLHLNDANIQPLNDLISVSACEEHDDYDPDYEGPWPNVYLDEQYVITIP
jgi:hypothetical protein